MAGDFCVLYNLYYLLPSFFFHRRPSVINQQSKNPETTLDAYTNLLHFIFTMTHVLLLVCHFLIQWRTLAILLALLNLKVLPLAWHVSLRRRLSFLSNQLTCIIKDPNLLRFLYPLLLQSPPCSQIHPHIPYTFSTHNLHLRRTTGRAGLQSPQIQRHVLHRSRCCARAPCLRPFPRRRSQIRVPKITCSEQGGLKRAATASSSRALHNGAGRRDLHVQTGAETLPDV